MRAFIAIIAFARRGIAAAYSTQTDLRLNADFASDLKPIWAVQSSR
jgi:hypothetical protein